MPFRRVCLGGLNSTCSEGQDQDSPVCAVCLDGWTMSGGKCIDCNNRAGCVELWIFIIAVIVLAVVLVVYYVLPRFGVHVFGESEEEQEKAGDTDEAQMGVEMSNYEQSATGIGIEIHTDEDQGATEQPVDVKEDVEPKESQSAKNDQFAEVELSTAFKYGGNGAPDTRQVGDSSHIIDKASADAFGIVGAGMDKLGARAEGSIFDGKGIEIPSISIPVETDVLKRFDDILGLAKVLLGFMQVVSSLSFNFGFVPWPSCVVDTWDAVGVVANINFLDGLTMDCVFSNFGFYDTFLITIMYPIAVMAAVFGITYWRASQARDDQEIETKANQGWKVSLFFLFLIYPSVSATILKIWDCEAIDGAKYLRSDYRLVCWEGEHTTYAALAAIAFVVYPVGIPAFFMYLLRKDRMVLHDEEHKRHESVHAKLSFLYRSYTKEAYYWEIVMLMQKLLLTGLLIFIKPNTTSQLAARFSISGAFFVPHIKTSAYANKTEDELQLCSMLSIYYTHSLWWYFAQH